MAFFFANAHADIDGSRGYEFFAKAAEFTNLVQALDNVEALRAALRAVKTIQAADEFREFVARGLAGKSV